MLFSMLVTAYQYLSPFWQDASGGSCLFQKCLNKCYVQ